MPKRIPPASSVSEPGLEKLLTTQDIADMLQLSVVKVYRLISLSGLPSIKIDGSRRFRPSEVQKWLEQHTQAS